MVKPYLLSKDKPLSLIQEFEEKLAQYTQAPYAIMTDCCTHALELCYVMNRLKQQSLLHIHILVYQC